MNQPQSNEPWQNLNPLDGVKLSVEASSVAFRELLVIAGTMSKTFGSKFSLNFDPELPLDPFWEKFAAGNSTDPDLPPPVSLNGGLAIDPRNPEQTVFSATSLNVQVGPDLTSVSMNNIVDAYILASKGSKDALEAIKGLEGRNLESFERALKKAKNSLDDKSYTAPKHMSL